MNIKIKVHGWAGIVILSAFAVLYVLWQCAMRATVDTEAVEALKPWIAGQFMNSALREAGGRPLKELSPQERKALGRKMMAAKKVEIRSIQARSAGENDIVVRVEALIDGMPPPDGKTIHYYRMHYSVLTGWSFDQEVGPLLYWLALW